MKFLFTLLFSTPIALVSKAQFSESFADSIQSYYKIPELAYAVVSSDSVLACQITGVQRINSLFTAKPTDRFHLGSNTKAITAFIAALLVKQDKINWNTKFTDLFTELRAGSKKVYRTITLENLLTFRGRLPPYTYTFDDPAKELITGDNAHQRYLLARYFLSQPPMQEQNGLTPSNADYILAGLMLEKAAGYSYKKLVKEMGEKLGISFGFDYPNLYDTLQPWGHDTALTPLPPDSNYKLNWLLTAGNINVSLPDYILFIQQQLKGLKGKSALLPQQVFNRLLFGLPVFAFGWFNEVDAATHHHKAFNQGNAGAFVTDVQLIKETGRAYIIFTNSVSPETLEGITVLQKFLQLKYGK